MSVADEGPLSLQTSQAAAFRPFKRSPSVRRSTVTVVFRCFGSRIVQELDWLIVFALRTSSSAFGIVRVFATDIG